MVDEMGGPVGNARPGVQAQPPVRFNQVIEIGVQIQFVGNQPVSRPGRVHRRLGGEQPLRQFAEELQAAVPVLQRLLRLLAFGAIAQPPRSQLPPLVIDIVGGHFHRQFAPVGMPMPGLERQETPLLEFLPEARAALPVELGDHVGKPQPQQLYPGAPEMPAGGLVDIDEPAVGLRIDNVEGIAAKLDDLLRDVLFHFAFPFGGKPLPQPGAHGPPAL